MPARSMLRTAERLQERGAAYSVVEALAWRAIVCAGGVPYHKGVWEMRSFVYRLAGEEPVSQVLQQFLGRLTEDEVFALHFSGAVDYLWMEVQWSLFENDELIYLPTDGDLSDIRGIVSVLPSSDFSEWNKLMTGSDLVFKKKCADGSDRSITLDGYGLFIILAWAAEFKQQKCTAGAVATSMEVHSKRTSPAAYSVESNSAAQTFDSSQAFGSSRYREAEGSLCKVLGEHIYHLLCPPARNAAITAEYCWLDAQFPDPSTIVSHLATAFERELRDGVLRSFCESLRVSGVRYYPESDGPAAGSTLSTRRVARPLPGMPVDHVIPLPVLFRGGQMNERLTLGDMVRLLERPLPAMMKFFAAEGLDASRLATVGRKVAALRNPAQHQGGLLRERASDIRRDWLGLADPGSSIFSALIRTKRNVDSAATQGPVDS
jgi:hypothetical protein